MNKDAQIKMLEFMHINAYENAETWRKVADAEKTHHAETKRKAWEIMRRGVKRENEFGDTTEVTLNIDDWRELCGAINFGV